MPAASLNYLLTSHVWRQDHNGFSHQDPGFIDHVANKKADIVRIYLPADANCLLSVADHCLRSRNYVNLIIAGKQPEWQWLEFDLAVRHCTAGAGTLDHARKRSTNTPINSSSSRCAVQGLPSQENEQIAHHTRALVLWSVARQSWETLAPDWEPVSSSLVSAKCISWALDRCPLVSRFRELSGHDADILKSRV